LVENDFNLLRFTSKLYIFVHLIHLLLKLTPPGPYLHQSHIDI